tara:strand:+ start:46 stop:171 length:126 start_codon:yes stop_codon:yes gene_type:complete
MERFIHNIIGLILVLLIHVIFGFEAIALALLFMIYSELKDD